MKSFFQEAEILTLTKMEEGGVPFFGRFGQSGKSQQSALLMVFCIKLIVEICNKLVQ
jgi:hypothetical protein